MLLLRRKKIKDFQQDLGMDNLNNPVYNFIGDKILAPYTREAGKK